LNLQIYFSRTIILLASSFDTKQRFLDTLREKFGWGTLNFNKGVTVDDLADYCSFLKEDFQNYGNEQSQRMLVECFTSHVGFQSNKYWTLSKQVKFIVQNLYWPNDSCDNKLHLIDLRQL
jgi:hypothetical protein